MMQRTLKLIAVLSLLFTTPLYAEQLKTDQPNIVVFLVDDMGLMDTSVPFLTDKSGNPERHPLNDFFRTPSMERLAKQGIRFSEFYAMSVCSPTRVSIMTGQTSARHHTTQFINPESNNRGDFGPDWQWKGISKSHVTLPAILQKAGYRTIHSGKAHFGPIGSYGSEPSNFGFDVNIAGCAFGLPGSYYGKENFGHGHEERQRRAVPGLKTYHGKDIFLTEVLTIEINEAISQSVKEKKPFFAYMSHYAVHSPFQSDPRFADNYKSLPEGAEGKSGHAFGTMIEGIDKSLGDILDHLDKLGVAENTIVFFLGDNGTDAPLGPTHTIACAAPLRGKKGTHYEGGMRVPFIAAWAKPDSSNAFQKQRPIARGAIISQLGAVYDLFPTVLAVAGASAPDKYVIDGVDLSEFFTGESRKREREFLMHFPHQHRSSYFTSYRRGDWKLIYHYTKPDDKRYELFNLAKDRDESNNLASNQPEKLREMIREMNESLEGANAQYPIKDGKKLRPELP